MLFLILGARRKQAFFTSNIDNIIFADNEVIILPNKMLKHTNPNRTLKKNYALCTAYNLI